VQKWGVEERGGDTPHAIIMLVRFVVNKLHFLPTSKDWRVWGVVTDAKVRGNSKFSLD
jgi:hypothetical protein